MGGVKDRLAAARAAHIAEGRVPSLKTKREAVELGLRTLLRLQHQTELRKLRGKYEWDGDLDAMRRDK